MRELALFAGACGGVLGTKLLGWKVIGYVEWNEYCQQLIAQRIADGVLDRAPIFGDIRAFTSEGFAASYTGLVDVLSAGFPCQPFSIAGKRKGQSDDRNMWPATIECIRMVRPRYAFLENVPGILASGYFGTILGDLAESGYDTRWRILSAAEVGAPHLRKRLWIVAYAKSKQASWVLQPRVRDGTGSSRAAMAYAKCESAEWGNNGAERRQWCQSETKDNGWSRNVPKDGWWATEPDVGRVAHGVASRVDRLKALGNGQVPLVAATAWRLLTETEREVAA